MPASVLLLPRAAKAGEGITVVPLDERMAIKASGPLNESRLTAAVEMSLGRGGFGNGSGALSQKVSSATTEGTESAWCRAWKPSSVRCNEGNGEGLRRWFRRAEPRARWTGCPKWLQWECPNGSTLCCMQCILRGWSWRDLFHAKKSTSFDNALEPCCCMFLTLTVSPQIHSEAVHKM
eukprot:s821_g4.t1